VQPLTTPEPSAAPVPRAQAATHRRTRKWKGWHIVFFSVLLVLVVLAILVALSSGSEFFHYGRSGCLFVHDRFGDMHFRCGTNLVPRSG
jgi:hypothetical protein